MFELESLLDEAKSVCCNHKERKIVVKRRSENETEKKKGRLGDGRRRRNEKGSIQARGSDGGNTEWITMMASKNFCLTPNLAPRNTGSHETLYPTKSVPKSLSRFN